MTCMPRPAASSDIFQAIAGPHRRAILQLVCEKELAVNEVVEALDLGQPSVSKHLKVLKEADLVTVRQRGRQRFYAGNPGALESVHRWVGTFERFWNHQLDAVEQRAQAAQATQPVQPVQPAQGDDS